jgi:hypothetical protein
MRERYARFGREVSEDDLRYTSSPAGIGEFTIVMEAGDIMMKRKASILRDEWWMNRR